jgi:hypothetical protein
MLPLDCHTTFPPEICAHRDVLLYLLPPLVLAAVFRMLARRHPVFFGFYLSGTILHELAHLVVGLLTNARPVNFSVLPRRGAGRQWILGSVSFANIRWYNAAFVGLAPILIVLVPVIVAVFRVQFGAPYGWMDVAIAALIAPAFLSFLPSGADLLVAARSWPYAVAIGTYLWWVWH